jgi:hypothetical protein
VSDNFLPRPQPDQDKDIQVGGIRQLVRRLSQILEIVIGYFVPGAKPPGGRGRWPWLVVAVVVVVLFAVAVAGAVTRIPW